MIHSRKYAVRAAVTVGLPIMLVLSAGGGGAWAQSPGWFVPEQPKALTPVQAPSRPAPAPRAPVQSSVPTAPPPYVPIPSPGSAAELGAALVDPQGPLPPLQVQLPPPPEIPPIPKGPATPTAIIGVLSVPDVMRVSTAYQQADRELGARRTRLGEDAQKEQNTLRDLGQSFANERAKLSPEQIRAREKDYAERVNESRRKFSERARIIQEAGQYVMAQIERAVELVAQQSAASRNVNLVFNRAQILGTTADFDLTPQVAEVLNKVLPSVIIPPDGVSPTKMGAVAAGPRAPATPEATPAKKN